MMALETILAQIEDGRTAIDARLNACNADLARLQAEIDDYAAEKEALGSAAGALRLLVERRASRTTDALGSAAGALRLLVEWRASRTMDALAAWTAPIAVVKEPDRPSADTDAPQAAEATPAVEEPAKLATLADIVVRNEPLQKAVAPAALVPPSAPVAFPVVATAPTAEASPPVAEAIPLSGSKAQLLADEIEAKLGQLMKIYPLGPTAKELSRHFGAPDPRVRDAVTRLGQKRIAYFRTQKEDGYLHLLPAAQAQ